MLPRILCGVPPACPSTPRTPSWASRPLRQSPRWTELLRHRKRKPVAPPVIQQRKAPGAVVGAHPVRVEVKEVTALCGVPLLQTPRWLLLLCLLLLMPRHGRSRGPPPRVPSFTESYASITTVAVTRDAGPWWWAPRVENAACGIQLIGIMNYIKKPNALFKDMGSDDGRLSGYRADTGSLVFSDVQCKMRTAFQLADQNFGKDDATVSFAVACTVSLDEEIGSWNLRSLHAHGHICRPLKTQDLVLRVHLSAPNATATMTVMHRSVPSPFITSPQFVVCGVQTYRNSLSASILPMFVHHYASLGYRVALFDRYGLHEEVIEAHFPRRHSDTSTSTSSSSSSSSSSFSLDYFPFTMLDRATHSNATKASVDHGYKVYYKEHLGAARSIDPSAKLERNTGLLDREKVVVTYDHCRLLYANAKAVLYVDTDEFLFCPSVERSYRAQSKHQHDVLHQLSDEGIDEIRLDTYPYDTHGSADIPALAACLKRAAAATKATTSLQSPHTFDSYALFHQCFSSRSTFPTWMKSADLGRRCPFHYNHWSCDGGKGGGRQLNCRCRVSIGPWMSLLQHQASTQQCHLMHLNPQQYQFQMSRNRRNAGNKTEYDAVVRAPCPPSPLSSLSF